MARQPAVFLAHGSPLLAVEQDDFTDALRRVGEGRPRPKGIAVVSGHWESPAPVRVTSDERPPQIYDFSGFPPELYDVRYPASGDPALAADIVRLLNDAGVPAAPQPQRGLDHGAWVPLQYAYPAADVPVVEVSLPTPRKPQDVAGIGKAMAPLREKDILLVGSGGIVHNLRRVRFEDKQAPAEDWAQAFDRWVRDRVAATDLAGLADYRKTAPHAAAAVPTPEHFDPVFFVLGATLPGDRVWDLYEGFQYGTLSMRSFALNS